VKKECLDAAIRQEHLRPPDAARRRVTRQRRRQVFANLPDDTAQGAHGAKNGVLM
jgi:hypothetical protein